MDFAQNFASTEGFIGLLAKIINDQTIIAHCLEIIEKSVYEFEKRITRSMLSGIPKSSNRISKKVQVLYRDVPKIPHIKTRKGIQLDNRNYQR